MSKISQIHGKCFCEKYRYTIRGELKRVVHCHCNNCRRSVGAPFVTWIVIKWDQYSIQPEPKSHTAKNKAIRTFCEECGTSLTYAHPNRSDFIDITAGTVNHPDSLNPDWHIWGKHKVEWVRMNDHLPFYDIFPE